MSWPRIVEAGDCALLLEFEPAIDPQVNARAVAAAARLRARQLPGVLDVVSTFRSVAVYFDRVVTDARAVRSVLLEQGDEGVQAAAGPVIDVPVAYGGEAGPDLREVADWSGLSTHEVIERHAAATYRVYMLGFLPGFAYMGSVDARIAAPRKAAPRLRVAAGSVGIAGLQTGIYPRESPGGWQIVGRTPLTLFDSARSPAALFAPGDLVRFIPQ